MQGEQLSPAELVGYAIERFNARDDEGFAGCFATDAIIWADSALAPACVLTGRKQIAAWCREARQRWSQVGFSHGRLSDAGSGAFVELDVVSESDGGGGAWRMPIAVFVEDGLVAEVMPQPDRESALAALGER